VLTPPVIEMELTRTPSSVFTDVWDAVDRLHQVMTAGEWRDPRFAVRAAVT